MSASVGSGDKGMCDSNACNKDYLCDNNDRHADTQERALPSLETADQPHETNTR